MHFALIFNHGNMKSKKMYMLTFLSFFFFFMGLEVTRGGRGAGKKLDNWGKVVNGQSDILQSIRQ